MPPTLPATSRQSSGPDHRDLYVIVIGVVLGILAGPAVFGRVAPQRYQSVFVGGQEQQRELDHEQRVLELAEQHMLASGSTPVGLEELTRNQQPKLITMEAQAQEARVKHLAQLAGTLNALVLAALALMVIETLVEPAARAVRARLSIARYALLSLWLALALAQPNLLTGTGPIFTAGLIILVLCAALVPLGRGTRHAAPPGDPPTGTGTASPSGS